MGAPPNVQHDAQRTLAAIKQLIREVQAESLGPDQVSFRRVGVQPPAGLYVTASEFISVKTLSSVANPALIVCARVLCPGRGVCPIMNNVTAIAAGSVNTQVFTLTEGFLLDLCVSGFGTTLQRGQCFVSVGIQRSGGSGQTPFECLAADYVTNTSSVAWPGGSIRGSVEGPGQEISTAVTQPAAGAELAFTVPTGTRLWLRSFHVVFTTSAVAANRIPRLVVDDGTNTLVDVPPAAALTAGVAWNLTWADGLANNTAFGVSTPTPFPSRIHLLGGWRIRTITSNIDPGDQYGAGRIGGEQWVEA